MQQLRATPECVRYRLAVGNSDRGQFDQSRRSDPLDRRRITCPTISSTAISHVSRNATAMDLTVLRHSSSLPLGAGQCQTPSHSHSIVPGGLLVTSYTTRFTPFTSLMMRVAVLPKNFMSNG